MYNDDDDYYCPAGYRTATISRSRADASKGKKKMGLGPLRDRRNPPSNNNNNNNNNNTINNTESAAKMILPNGMVVADADDDDGDGWGAYTETVDETVAVIDAADDDDDGFDEDEDDGEGSGGGGRRGGKGKGRLDDDMGDRREDACYYDVYRSAGGVFRGMMGHYYGNPCSGGGGGGSPEQQQEAFSAPHRSLEDIVPALKKYLPIPATTAAPSPAAAPPTATAPPLSAAAVSPPEATPAAADVIAAGDSEDGNSSSLSLVFPSMETPIGMKESPASRYMRGEGGVEGGGSGPGIVFPIGPLVNRSALQGWLCGGEEGEKGKVADTLSSLPWLSGSTLSHDSVGDVAGIMAALRACAIPREAVHVGYIMADPACLGLACVTADSPAGQCLLANVPNARVAYASTSCAPSAAEVDTMMKAIYPFLKSKSRSDPDALALAVRYVAACGGGAAVSGAAVAGGAAGAAPSCSSTSTVMASPTASAASLQAKLDAEAARMRERGIAAATRYDQQEVAAINRAHKALREAMVSPLGLASYLLGREVAAVDATVASAEPSTVPAAAIPPLSPLISRDDALALKQLLITESAKGKGNGGGGADDDANDSVRWLCIDFEAAVVGKFEQSVPVEVGVVEAFAPTAARTATSASAPTSAALLTKAAASPSAYGPSVDALLDAVGSCTNYYSLIAPGMLSDSSTAARLSLMACRGGGGGGANANATCVSGHGIPHDCLSLLRSDYAALAKELVAALGLEHLFIANPSTSAKPTGAGSDDGNNESSSSHPTLGRNRLAQSRTVLINKGPTLVDIMCLRWCLAAANDAKNSSGADDDGERYDLSLEGALAIPMFDSSALAQLVGIVRRSLGLDGGSSPVDKSSTDAASSTPLSPLPSPLLPLPKEPAAKMLCACAYHWELYESGVAERIARQANELLRDGMFIPCDEEGVLVGEEEEALIIDIHCARSDAFYLKCQVEDMLQRLLL